MLLHDCGTIAATGEVLIAREPVLALFGEGYVGGAAALVILLVGHSEVDPENRTWG